MQKSGIILLVATIVLQVCFCAPPTPVDPTTVDLFIDYYMENVVYYFYPIAPLIESELNKILQLVNDSSIGRDVAKAKTLQYIRIFINKTLTDLKRRDQGCPIHLGLITTIFSVRNLIVDTGERELLAKYNMHADAIEEAIDWKYYDSHIANVTNQIETAYKAHGFEKEYKKKLAAKKQICV